MWAPLMAICCQVLQMADLILLSFGACLLCRQAYSERRDAAAAAAADNPPHAPQFQEQDQATAP